MDAYGRLEDGWGRLGMVDGRLRRTVGEDGWGRGTVGGSEGRGQNQNSHCTMICSYFINTENPHTTLHGLSGVNQGSGPRTNTNGLKLINHP